MADIIAIAAYRANRKPSADTSTVDRTAGATVLLFTGVRREPLDAHDHVRIETPPVSTSRRSKAER